MKRKMAKLAAMTMAATMTAGLLAGCGGSSADSSSDAATEDTAEETGDAAAESTEDASGETASAEDIGEPNGGKEVTVWHYFEHEAAALNKLCKEYNEQQSDIYVVPTYISREELMKQYTIGAVSGELPDIGMVDSPDMASYISLGVFEDITSQLEGWEDLS